MITVAVRRVNISDRSKESLLDYIDTSKYFLLPNTAGCYTADEAVRTARLGREAGLSNWVKLEVIGDERTLFPDNEALIEATRVARARRLRRAALHERRSGRLPQARRRRRGGDHAARRADRLGPRHPERQQPAHHPRVRARAARSSTPASARRRTRRWRWSSAPTRVLMNTAIAGAQDPVAMAEAMKLAVRAGRLAYPGGPHPAQDVREREQPGRRPGRPVDDAEEPGRSRGAEGRTGGRRSRLQRRAHAPRSRHPAAAGRFSAAAAGPRRTPGHAAQHALEDRRAAGHAAAGAASSPASGARSRRCSSSSRRSTRPWSITSTATCRSRARRARRSTAR